MANKVTDPVLAPTKGLYLDRSEIAMDPRMLSDVLNVRIKDGHIVRENMGWAAWPSVANAINLDGRPVTGFANFFPSDGGNFLLLMNTTDVFEYDEPNTLALYLTPRYETGTVDVTNGSAVVTGTSTSWSANLKTGDFFHAGATGQRSQSATWYEIASVDSDTQITLTTNYAEATDTGLAYTARQTFTGDMLDYWESDSFTRVGGSPGGSGSRPDRIYLTNGIDSIVAWDGGSDQLYTPSLGNIEAARTVAVYKNMLILANVTVSGEQKPFAMRNSAIGQPENHTSLEASELIVHDGSDPILAVATLGDTLTFYAERHITLAQFVGDPILFTFRFAVQGLGAMSGRSVADFGDSHTFLGPDAQYSFDGVSVTESGFQVWREVLRRISPQRLDLLMSHFDEENGELLWVVPLNTDTDSQAGTPEMAYVEHYLEFVGDEVPTPVTFRDLPATATGFFQQEASVTWQTIGGTWEEQTLRWNDRALQALFPLNLFGTADGDIYILGAADSHAGSPFAGFARGPRMPLGDTRRKGVLTRVYAFTERLPLSSYDLEVYVHVAEQARGPTTEHGPFLFDLAHGDGENHFVSPYVSGRYAELEFRTSSVSRIWKLAGWQIERQVIGER